jgi:hypothetical protein
LFQFLFFITSRMSTSNSHYFAPTAFSPFASERSVIESAPPSFAQPLPLGSTTVYRSFAREECASEFGVDTKPPQMEKFMPHDRTLGLTKPSPLNAFPELKLMPSGIAKFTSFVSRTPPTVLFGKILETLCSSSFGMTVDLQPHSSKMRFNGQGLSGGTRTGFSINFYKNPSWDVVVECCRQEGCVVLFNKLYQRMLTCLGDAILRRLSENSPPTLSDFPLPALPSFPCPPCRPLILSLLDRVSSVFLDQQIQACESLLELSRGDGAVELLGAALDATCSVDVLGVMCCLFKIQSEDAVRMTALMVENLLKLGSTAFMERALQLVAPMCEILDGPVTYQNRDTKRHLSVGLHMIAATRRDAFSAEHLQVLERCPLDPIKVQATIHVA